MLNMENIALVEVEDEDNDDTTEDDTVTNTLMNESSILRDKLEKGSLDPDEVQMLLNHSNQEDEEEDQLHTDQAVAESLSAEQAYGHRASTRKEGEPAGSLEEGSLEYVEAQSSLMGYSVDENSVTAVQGKEHK